MADDSYKVGFGKPPKHTRFQKGRSGNPKGRPKGSKNVLVLIRKILRTKVVAKGPEGNRSMTMEEAAIQQLVNKAANGDLKAIKEVIGLSRQVQEQEPYLDNAPIIQVNFVDPKDGRPLLPGEDEDDEDKEN